MNNYEVPLNTDPVNLLHHHQIKGAQSLYKYKMDKIKTQKVDKKFYLGLSFEAVSNPEFNSEMLYPVEFVKPINKFYMPQINRISFAMPPAPIYYQFNETPAVCFKIQLNILYS